METNIMSIILTKCFSITHGTGEMIYKINSDADDNTSSNNKNSNNNNPTTLVESHKGSWEEGYWQGGHGTQRLNSGDRLIGEFDKSLRIFGEYKWKEEEQQQTNFVIRKQRVYQGGFHENGRPHGHGKYTWTTITIDTNNNTKEQKSVSSYVGMFENGQRQGHGVYTSSALTYTGDWMLGKYHGYGVLKVPSKKSTYRGQFHFGKKDGKGEEVVDDGTIIHEGLWREDRPFIQEKREIHDEDEDNEKSKKSTYQTLSTIFQTPTEIIDGEGIQGLYKGIVEESLPSGVGTITYKVNHHPTGIVQYEGFFDRGIRQGYGHADFGNGDHFSGNFNNGVFEGSGEYFFANGRIYKGVWLEGLPHDTEAKFVWPNSDLFEGVYENGHRKSGRIVFADGAYYQGEFYSPDGNYGGEGRLVTLLVSYEGGFRDGAFHGKGCLKKNNGFVIFDGEWVDGKAVRDDVLISIPQDLLITPNPPVDDDFGEFEDGPASNQASDLLSTIQRKISPPPRVPIHAASSRASSEANAHPSLSSTIMGKSTKFIESITSNFSSIHVSETNDDPKQEQCKAVVDMTVSDAQDNPGRYTGILHLESQRPHGVGRMVYLDGNRIHEGFWSDGHREGHGRCMFAKIGDFHEGEYKQNLREGPGKYFWKDGRQFVGNYHNDECSGEGKFIYSNGDMYVGNFENGSRSGYGVFTFSQKTCEYRGDWRNSTYNGSGRLKWVSDDGTLHVYEGEFRDGIFHGKGKEMVGDNLKRQGWWIKGSYKGEEDPAGGTNQNEESCDQIEGKTEGADNLPTKAKIEEFLSKDECPTTLEQNYSDVRLQWKRSLEPASA